MNTPEADRVKEVSDAPPSGGSAGRGRLGDLLGQVGLTCFYGFIHREDLYAFLLHGDQTLGRYLEALSISV